MLFAGGRNTELGWRDSHYCDTPKPRCASIRAVQVVVAATQALTERGFLSAWLWNPLSTPRISSCAW